MIIRLVSHEPSNKIVISYNGAGHLSDFIIFTKSKEFRPMIAPENNKKNKAMPQKILLDLEGRQ